MIKATNFKISLAHLSSRVKQAAVAVLSVTFGISMYIFMNGFMTGVNNITAELAFTTLAHIRIYNDLPEDQSNILSSNYDRESTLVNLRSGKVIQYTKGIKNSDAILSQLDRFPEVENMTVQVNENVYFRNGAVTVSGSLSGVNARKEDQLFGTSDAMLSGSWFQIDQQKNGIVLGTGLARRLSVSLNDNVVVSTSNGIEKSFKIIGIVETTLASIDNTKAFISINTARQLISENSSYATDIQININDYNQSRAVAKLMEPVFDYKVESWNEANGQLEAGNGLRDILAIAVSLTILLVAGFGIYNIMNMTVNEKIKEIAILKAMGFEGNDIVEIFLVQSLIIGLIGGLVGILFGGSVSLVVNRIPFEIASIDTLPMAYRTSDYLSAFGFGLLTTFIAGYLPAKKASKVDPVQIIRG